MSKIHETTILDLAEFLKVNPSTVSRALNDHPRISRKTKERVLAAARLLNYEQNHIAAALRKGKSSTVGVLVPKLDRSFFASVVRGIEEVVKEAGYNVIICQSSDRQELEVQGVDALLRSQVEGIIVSISRETKQFEHFEKIKEKGIPLILFDRVLDEMNVSTVEVDDYQGGYLATRHLIEQGCRKIAHLAGSQNLKIYQNRLEGYRAALKEAGLTPNPDWIIESDLQMESGRELMEQLLSQPDRPDAVFSASDYAAVGAMQILKDKGIRIPEQVAVAGFSDEPFTRFIDPPLTSVKQFSYGMGREAARMFLEQIAVGRRERVIHQTRLQPELIIRASSLKKVD